MKVAQLGAARKNKERRDYAALVLDANERLFGEFDRQQQREQRREERWNRAEIERLNHQKL